MAMTSWNKILVGVDFSEQARLAIEYAVAIAQKVNATVVLAHARPSTMASYAALESLGTHHDVLYREALAENERRLQDLAKLYHQDGVELQAMVLDGVPETALATAAQEVAADLVVVGTHGRKGLRRLFLGSVAEKTIRASSCDVLVVRGTQTTKFDKILVPSDFSEPADRALERAVSLSGPGTTLELLHFWQLPTAAVGWTPKFLTDSEFAPLRQELADAAEAGFSNREQRVAELTDQPITVQSRVVEDSPTHGLLAALTEGDYDLVVMGSHGRSGFKRWLLGSVAEVATRYAHTPLLIVH